jgi:hypothetical protein
VLGYPALRFGASELNSLATQRQRDIGVKIRKGSDRAVQPMSSEQLNSLSTRALIGRLSRLRQCEESPAMSDLSAAEILEISGIYFKSSPEWSSAYNQVKSVLSLREHVVRGVRKN